MEPRALAATILSNVFAQRRSLGAALATQLNRAAPRDRALVQKLCYGVLRWHLRLDALLTRLIQRPLKSGDADVQCLLRVGIYQLAYMRVPPHAAVSETVAAARRLNKPWASGLVNGVLRAFQRDATQLLTTVDQDDVARTAHPRWLLTRLQQAWPDDWERIVAANNRHAPFTLRVNRCRVTRDGYLDQLRQSGHGAHAAPFTPDGIALDTAVDVATLPGFAAGLVSVQDAAAQLAALLLDPQPGQRVLDACAAPGGKTAHLLEAQPALRAMVAVDNDPQRAQRIRDTLARLGLNAAVVVADVAQPATWWDGKPFERMLLDAPCSASGVIRRHPDIKYLKRNDDIAALGAQQQRLLDALWPLLAPGGMLLYATCSVFPEENSAPIDHFLRCHNDAAVVPIDAAWGHELGAGRQILPGEDDMDGFFYALLRKAC